MHHGEAAKNRGHDRTGKTGARVSKAERKHRRGGGDALHVDLFQEDERPSAHDGSGWVVDEVAEEVVDAFTEEGPLQPERGAESLVPGRDNTSTTQRRHHPNAEVARGTEDVGNRDEPKDEGRRLNVDEGTAA